MCIGTHVRMRSLHLPANCDRNTLSYPLIGRYTCVHVITSRTSELRSQHAILSVDRIRYRYSQLVTIHSIDVANRSGDRIARRPLGDWCQSLCRHGTNHKSRSTLCATQKSRNSRMPHTESACGHGMRRKGDHIPPDRMYAQHGQQIYSTICFSSLSTTRPTDYTSMLSGALYAFWHTDLRLHVFMYIASPHPHPQVIYLFHIEPAMLLPRLSTILVLTIY
jgi:hypothetical protein